MSIHANGGIRTRDPSKRVAADLRLRPRGHRDEYNVRVFLGDTGQFYCIQQVLIYFANKTSQILYTDFYSIRLSVSAISVTIT